MVEVVRGVSFNIFDKGNASRWQSAKSQFTNSNEEIKNATRDLIDSSFRCAI